MADQLTPFLTGAYGHPDVHTPGLNKLVSEGVRFDAAYSPYPLTYRFESMSTTQEPIEPCSLEVKAR
ncbi:MAG: hypothetical protein GY759_10680 [Chloroflexi bacterium]|nr:hypothetical protein [Chloroflexota bacterium]